METQIINTSVNSVEIVKLTSEEWRQYKQLYLEALQSEPHAFRHSYEDEIELPDSEWKNRMNSFVKENSCILLFASYNGRFAGTMTARWGSTNKVRHIATIETFYVSKEYRAKGVGKKLFESMINFLHFRKNVLKIKLAVVTGQEAAVKLYKSFGFRQIGIIEKELCVDGTYYDEYKMELLFE